MYTHFYNLNQEPFNPKLTARFLYLGEPHKEALATLTYAVQERKGFILLTGEQGTGKTAMVQALVKNLDSSYQYIYLPNPANLSPKELLLRISTRLGFRSEFRSKGTFLAHFQSFLEKLFQHQQTVLLLVDDAHELSFDLMEEIRLLSNIETADHKLITVVLVGRPELNDKLSQWRCEPLRQRINIRHHLRPLHEEETREYIATRLRAAGAEKEYKVFPRNTIKALFQYTQGLPKRINILADRVFQLGYTERAHKISPVLVKKAFRSIQKETPLSHTMWQNQNQSGPRKAASGPYRRRWKRAALLLIALAFGFSLYTERPVLLRQFVERVPVFLKLKTEGVIKSGNAPIKKAADGVARKLSDYSKKATTYYKIIKQEAEESQINLDALVTLAEASQYSTEAADQGGMASWVTIVTRKGDTLTSLAIRAYGFVNRTILDLLMRNNPEIVNVDRIEGGKKVFFPPLFETRNNSPYTVHIASYKPIRYAEDRFQMLIHDRYDPSIIPIQIPRKGRFYRVTVGSFRDMKEARDYASAILAKGISDYAQPIRIYDEEAKDRLSQSTQSR
ncbi:MAG TPA: AAA family ATPase [Desulfatiglandales bacterium]|nr:AAA family ATPase [Desulfatiglandales bacterium]